ncbi:hypothetical protein IO706_000159 [Vibrio cholerae]|nr:hypothetical protein [Vibrio cholerae]
MKKWKIKYTVLFCALMPLIASAKITEFGTKNDVYPKPNPPSVSEVPGDVKNKILNCPSFRDILPVKFHGINNGSLSNWYNGFLVVGRQNSENYTNAYSEFIIDKSKSYPVSLEVSGYVFDKQYNKISNSKRIYLYRDGFSPRLSATPYSKFVNDTNGDNDKMPLFVSETLKVGQFVDDPLILPNKDFTVAEVFVANSDYDLRSWGNRDEWLWDLIRGKEDRRMYARLKISRSGNNIIFDSWINGDKTVPMQRPADSADSYHNYDKFNILKNIDWDSNGGYGRVVLDVAKVKDIQIFLSKHYTGKGALWIMANIHGERPWIFDGKSRLTPDFSVTNDMLKKANDFYERNKCFVYN